MYKEILMTKTIILALDLTNDIRYKMNMIFINLRMILNQNWREKKAIHGQSQLGLKNPTNGSPRPSSPS